MIKIKHLCDAVEADDGRRLWVEPVGLTVDMREWCRIDALLPGIAPPGKLTEWLEKHRDGYEYFRGEYHNHLTHAALRPLLMELACDALTENITLVHQGDNPEENTGTALYEFLTELQPYCRTRKGKR